MRKLLKAVTIALQASAVVLLVFAIISFGIAGYSWLVSMSPAAKVEAKDQCSFFRSEADAASVDASISVVIGVGSLLLGSFLLMSAHEIKERTWDW